MVIPVTLFIAPCPLATPCLRRDPARRAAKVTSCSKPTSTSSENRTPAPINTPVHKAIPYIGAILDFFNEEKRSDKLAQRYGPIYRADFVGQPLLVVADYGTAREVLKDRETFVGKGAWPTPILNGLGQKFLSNIDGQEHSAARQRVAPVFMKSAVTRAISQILPTYHSMWRDVHNQVRESANANGVNIKPILRKHSLKVVIVLTMGGTVDVNNFNKLEKLFTRLVDGLIFPKFMPPGFLAVQARQKILAILIEIIKEHARSKRSIITKLRESENFVADSEEQKEMSPRLRDDVINGRVDLLSVLCAISGAKFEETGSLSEDTERIIEELSDQILFIWFAALSTTSNSLSNAVFELSKDSALLEELREELFCKLDRLNDRGRDDELIACVRDHKTKLPILTAFIEEVFRFHAPAPAFRSSSRDSFIRGHKVSKGDLIMLDFFAANRYNGNFENAGVFQADRFLDRDNLVAREAPILSFGAPGSPHFCMGYQLARYSIILSVCILIGEWNFEMHPSVAKDRYAIIPETGPGNGIRLIELTERKCYNL